MKTKTNLEFGSLQEFTRFYFPRGVNWNTRGMPRGVISGQEIAEQHIRALRVVLGGKAKKRVAIP